MSNFFLMQLEMLEAEANRSWEASDREGRAILKVKQRYRNSPNYVNWILKLDLQGDIGAPGQLRVARSRWGTF